MSSMDEASLEFFVWDSFLRLTAEEARQIVALMEPKRAAIEASMESYDPETQSWRDYRNGMDFYFKDVEDKISLILKEDK